MIARYSTVSLFAAACLVVMAAGSTRALAAEEQEAGLCSGSTTKTLFGNSAQIRTLVKNASSGNVFSVVISRNGTEKESGTLNENNSQVGYIMSVGNPGNQQIDVTAEITGHNSSVLPKDRRIYCNYKIQYDNNKNTATWSLPDGADSICSDSIAITCKDCKLSCATTYVGSNIDSRNRWTTVFTIHD